MSAAGASILSGMSKETGDEIESLVEELADRVDAPVSPQQFYRELLERAVRATATVAGAVWVCENEPRLDAQIRLTQAFNHADPAIAGPHRQLLERVANTSQPAIVSPGAGGPDGVDNPTSHVLIFHPVVVDDDVVAVVELCHDADRAPSVHRGCLELLGAMCELTADFHRNHRFRELRDREAWRTDFDRYVHAIHRGHDVRRVVFAIANESRRAVGCDRVTVLLRRGSRYRVAAVSDLETFDRRSSTLQRLERLTRMNVRAGSFWWRAVNTGVDDEGRDEEIAAKKTGEATGKENAEIHAEINADETRQDAGDCRLAQYASETSLAQIGIELLTDPDRPNSRPVGALVVECFSTGTPNEMDSSKLDVMATRTRLLIGHGSLALAKAVTLSRLPLMPVSRALVRAGWMLHWRRLPWTVLLVLMLAGLVAALVVVPVDFEIEGRGELQPVVQRTIFAPQDGVVVGFPAISDEMQASPQVGSEDIVVRLHNAELEYELASVLGEKETADRQHRTVSATLESGERFSLADKARFDELSARRLELEVQLKSLDQRLEILRAQREELDIRAGIDGQVQTWDVVHRLQSRPVRRGQRLMQIADRDGHWVAELYIPDKHVGYVQQANAASDRPLPVRFQLKSSPGVDYTGHLRTVDQSTELHTTYGPAVRVTVDIDRPHDLQSPRPGTTMIGKIHCGRRSLGFVWLHDLIEEVRSRLLF